MIGLVVSPGSRQRQARSRVERAANTAGRAGSRAGQAVHATATRLANFGAVRAVRQVPDDVADGALAAVFLAAMLIERTAPASLSGAQLPFAVALSMVVATGLALRRRAPLAAYLAGSAALAAEALWVSPSPVSPYANLIGLYSVGLYATRSRALWGPPLVLPGALAYFSGAGSSAPAESAGVESAGVLFSWLLAWAVGYGAARRREEQEATRQAMRRQAVADERSRLARELHDLIGHTVNVMVVQAGAGRVVLDRDPAKTREILTVLEHTGRQALTELDRVLGILRRDDRPGAGRTDAATELPGAAAAGQPGTGVPVDEENSAVPGIADLPRLARRVSDAGIRVTVRVDPPTPPEVARSVDLSTYRIVQEALTNTLKHGAARSATVTVRLDEREVEIEVCDDGHGAPAGYLPGRGLLGISERVTAFGGTLQHGGGERGGFQLRAVLPLPLP